MTKGTNNNGNARQGTRRLVYRHTLPVRIMHWINVLALTLLFMSGLQIFNAHPHLYWGSRSDPNGAILSIDAERGPSGQPRGITQVGPFSFNTTGVLGVSSPEGYPELRAFPSWLTVPGPQWLSMGRRWHFFFAWVFVINGFCYVIFSLIRKHLQKDLWPTRDDWRGFGQSISDHIRFRHPKGEDALRYNVLQKLTYLIVIFVFGSGIVLMGLAMSPRMDAVLQPVLDLVGGRQSARTLHFIIAWAFVGFVAVHVFEVIVNGLFNHLRGMITGYHTIETAAEQPTTGTDEETRHD